MILSIKDNLTKDLVYILMAKGLHCISIKVCTESQSPAERWHSRCKVLDQRFVAVTQLSVKHSDLVSSQDFAHARQLFSACLELVTEFSPKLRQVMLNEMLLLEVRAHETMAAEGSKERPPPDLVSRVRGYLEMRIHGGWSLLGPLALWSCSLEIFDETLDLCLFLMEVIHVIPDLPLRQVVGEECVAFMLNWRENDYLTLQVPPSLVMNNPYIKVKRLHAADQMLFCCFKYYVLSYSLNPCYEFTAALTRFYSNTKETVRRSLSGYVPDQFLKTFQSFSPH